MYMQVCMYATHGIVIPYIASKAQCVILNGLYYNEIEMYFDVYSTKERINSQPEGGSTLGFPICTLTSQLV